MIVVVLLFDLLRGLFLLIFFFGISSCVQIILVVDWFWKCTSFHWLNFLLLHRCG